MLRDGGKSLLPIGVIEVQGEFQRGEVVACVAPAAARSRADSSTTAHRGAADRAQAVGEIEALLGFVGEPELIHRDNLVLG